MTRAPTSPHGWRPAPWYRTNPGKGLDITDTHVSYYRGPSFAELAAAFAHANGGGDTIELTTSSDPGRGQFTDRAPTERWREYHQEHAVLGLLSSQENLRRPRR